MIHRPQPVSQCNFRSEATRIEFVLAMGATCRYARTGPRLVESHARPSSSPADCPSASLLFDRRRPAKSTSEKIFDQFRDLVRLLEERKMAGIEDVNLRFGQIPLISAGFGNQERGIVPAPNDQSGRL